MKEEVLQNLMVTIFFTVLFLVGYFTGFEPLRTISAGAASLALFFTILRFIRSRRAKK